MASGPVLVWFRRDLRLSDHPALSEACRKGPVIPLFILDETGEGSWPMGGASRWWLHRSLEALAAQLAAKGSRLIIRRGDSLAVLREMIRETGTRTVHWSRRYEPAAHARDEAVRSALSAQGVDAEEFAAALLFEPETIRTRSGGPYRVFTPFWRACQAAPEPLLPLSAPRTLIHPEAWPVSMELADLELLPEADWAGGLRETWRPGASAAGRLLREKRAGVLTRYVTSRELP